MTIERLPAGFAAEGVVATPTGASIYGTGGAKAGNTAECTVLEVEPSGVPISRPRAAPCGSELLPGLWLVTTVGHFKETLHLEHPGRTASSGGVLGPALQSFDNWDLSHDGRPALYGDTVWIYDDMVKPSIVLRVDGSSGRLQARVAVPGLGPDPVLAADDDGLYIAPSVGWDQYPGVPPIYHVGPSATRATVAYHGGPVQWMVASDGELWAQLAAKHPSEPMTIVGLRAASAIPLFAARTTLALGPDGGFGGSYAVVGDAEVGLYTLVSDFNAPGGGGQAPCSGTLEVVRIDPDTGRQRVVATVRPPTSTLVECQISAWLNYRQAVVVGDSLLLLWDLTPYGHRGPYTGLYRIRLSPR